MDNGPFDWRILGNLLVGQLTAGAPDHQAFSVTVIGTHVSNYFAVVIPTGGIYYTDDSIDNENLCLVIPYVPEPDSNCNVM